MNLTKESEEMEKSIEKPKIYDSIKITKYLKKYWGEEATYNKKEKTIYLYNNEILAAPEFLELLKKYRCFIQPSLI